MLLDLTQDEATIRTATRPGVSVGDGVRLQIRVPDLVDFEVPARVTWSRDWPTADGPAGFGAQLSAVSLPIRLALQRWLSENPAGGGACLGVEIVHKFTVRRERGCFELRLNGVLDGRESRRLCDSVLRELDATEHRSTLVYIDARELRACPEDSLPEFGLWFRRLARRPTFTGVLFAGCAIARLQMRRLARESGIGNTLVCFEDEDDAKQFWNELRAGGALADQVV